MWILRKDFGDRTEDYHHTARMELKKRAEPANHLDDDAAA